MTLKNLLIISNHISTRPITLVQHHLNLKEITYLYFLKNFKIFQEIYISTIHPPTIDEIEHQLKVLKNNKASNDIAPDILKACNHPIMNQVIHRMTLNLWNNLDIANAWGNSKLKSLWKNKGSKSDPTKYREISIGSTVCKLIINIILERLRPLYETQLSDEQNGFRQNCGTTDGILTLKRVQQITQKKLQPLYLLFVDLTAAFDHISRDWLFKSIEMRFTADQTPRLVTILSTLQTYNSHL